MHTVHLLCSYWVWIPWRYIMDFPCGSSGAKERSHSLWCDCALPCHQICVCVVFCLWNLENWFCFIYGIRCKCQVVSIRFLLLLCGMRKLETMKPPPEIWHSRQRMISHDLRVNRIVDSERYRICFCMFFFHSFDHLLNSIKYSIFIESLSMFKVVLRFVNSETVRYRKTDWPANGREKQTNSANARIYEWHQWT